VEEVQGLTETSGVRIDELGLVVQGAQMELMRESRVGKRDRGGSVGQAVRQHDVGCVGGPPDRCRDDQSSRSPETHLIILTILAWASTRTQARRRPRQPHRRITRHAGALAYSTTFDFKFYHLFIYLFLYIYNYTSRL
jgi:hypothetical protein